MKHARSVLAATLGATTLLTPVAGADTTVEPLYTKSAQVYDSFVVDAYAEYYKDRLFQEIDAVDATELRIDLTFPILSHGQLRLSLPFYTDGDGKIIDNG